MRKAKAVGTFLKEVSKLIAFAALVFFFSITHASKNERGITTVWIRAVALSTSHATRWCSHRDILIPMADKVSPTAAVT